MTTAKNKKRRTRNAAPTLPAIFVADAKGLAANVPVGIAIAFHQATWNEVKKAEALLSDGTTTEGEADFAKLCKVEHHALLAITLAFKRDLAEAAQAAVYLASYWRAEPNAEDAPEAAWPYLSQAIGALANFLPDAPAFNAGTKRTR